MPLTALRRSALIPDHPFSTVSSSWPTRLIQEAETSNINSRPSLFVPSLANDSSSSSSYQWTSSCFTTPEISPRSIQFSSWDLNVQVASTPPRQTASASASQADKPSSSMATSADSILDTSDIDQWLLGDVGAGVSSSFALTNNVTNGSSTAAENTPSCDSVNLQEAVNTSPSMLGSQQARLHPSHYYISKPTTYRVSREIVLRSLIGDPSLDIYYPQSGILQALDDQGQMVIVTGGLMSYSSPPPEDFATERGDKIARGQPEKRRCNEDIYTPLWVRGDGINREGWCSLCNPGRWLNLKTSQYLYHLQNTHGVIQTTGLFCPPPLQLRIHEDSVGTTEGWCGNCQQWISICTVRKRRSFSAWFDHARKCRSSKRRQLLNSQSRRAMSSSPAMRLRAVKKEGHQRVSSFQEMSSYIVDFADSPCSSSSAHKHEECDFAYSDSSSSKRARCG